MERGRLWLGIALLGASIPDLAIHAAPKEDGAASFRVVVQQKDSQVAWFSPDGTTAATLRQQTGNYPITILRLWDVETRRMIGTLWDDPSTTIDAVAFSHDGTRVALGLGNGGIREARLDYGLALRTIRAASEKPSQLVSIVYSNGIRSEVRRSGDAPRYLQYTPDGRALLVQTDSGLGLLEAENGKSARTFETPREGIVAARLTPDGKDVLVCTKGRLQLWDATSRSLVGESSIAGAASAMALSNDGQVVGVSSDRGVVLFDFPRLALRSALRPPGRPKIGIEFCLGDQRLALADETGTSFWTIGKDRPDFTLDGGRPALSPNGKLMVSGSVVYDSSGQRIGDLGADGGRISDAAFSADGGQILLSLSDGLRVAMGGTGALAVGQAQTSQVPRSIVYGTDVIGRSPDDRLAVVVARGTAAASLYDVSNQRALGSIARDVSGGAVAFSHDSRVVLLWSRQEAYTFDSVACRLLAHIVARPGSGSFPPFFTRESARFNSASLSGDGSHLTTSSPDGTRVWDARTGEFLGRGANLSPDASAAESSPDGTKYITGYGDGSLSLWSLKTHLRTPLPKVHQGRIDQIEFSPDGQRFLTSSADGTAKMWSLPEGRPLTTLGGHRSEVSHGRFSPDGTRVLTLAKDGSVRLWDPEAERCLCTINCFADGSWVVTDPYGRFDAPRLDSDVWLNLVAADAPLKPFPVEIFMRDYFSPGLLQKILHGQSLAPARSILALNRAQPKVSTRVLRRDEEGQVTVSVMSGTAEVERDGKSVLQTGLPQDLRVFVDGKLIASERGALALDAQGRWARTYRLRLPRNGEKAVEVSAYCFNQDRVKSETVRQTLTAGLPPRKGKAYVISVGVDRYDRSDLALRFSAADATTISETLKARLVGYAEVVAVPLLSDATHHDATKARFHAVLDALAGRKADLHGVPNGDRLAESTPEDLVVISWSGHGLASKEGQFYLLPEDVKNDPDTFGKPFLDSCVSTDELTEWLRDVNVGDMALIVDACHSAAAVQSEEFKPGPLGNRGLGQLAYDKGIRVLAATQATDVALESDRLGNGLLTYALFHDGLAAGKAPTLKEWLAAAVDDVPRLYEALEKGTLRAARTANAGVEPKTSERDFRQRPALFDYTRRPSSVPFVGR